MSEVQSHSEQRAGLALEEPFLISAEQAEKHWAQIGQIIDLFRPWSLLIDSEHVRKNVASERYQLFGLFHDGALSIAVACLVNNRDCGPLLGMSLFAPDSIPGGSLEKLIGCVEQVARERGCVAISIQAFPWHASVLGGPQKVVIIERDLRRSEKEAVH